MRPLSCLLTLLLTACAVRDNTHLSGTAPGTQLRSGGIALDLRTDKPLYRIGEKIEVTLTASERSEVTIWSEDAQGKRTPVWPRPGAGRGIVAKNQPLRLPPPGADWELQAAEPKGINTLVATARAIRPAAATSANNDGASAPVFFQIPGGPGGWKGDRGIAVTSPGSPPLTGSRAAGDVRWLYGVK